MANDRGSTLHRAQNSSAEPLVTDEIGLAVFGDLRGVVTLERTLDSLPHMGVVVAGKAPSKGTQAIAELGSDVGKDAATVNNRGTPAGTRGLKARKDDDRRKLKCVAVLVVKTDAMPGREIVGGVDVRTEVCSLSGPLAIHSWRFGERCAYDGHIRRGAHGQATDHQKAVLVEFASNAVSPRGKPRPHLTKCLTGG
jgi:hypothetical protein